MHLMECAHLQDGENGVDLSKVVFSNLHLRQCQILINGASGIKMPWKEIFQKMNKLFWTRE